VAIDQDGNLQTAALEAKGLITLPVVDAEIAVDAAIQESKLDLNHTTNDLYNAISAIAADLGSTQGGYSTLATALSTHLLGTGQYHDGYAIKLNAPTAPQNGIGGLTATTVGDALNQLGELVLPHVDMSPPAHIKHRASEVSVDSSSFIVLPQSSGYRDYR
jgi:hypothetical protein